MPAALLVVGNSASLTTGDTAVQSRLTALGYTVTVLDDSNAAPSFTGLDVVVMAPSCDNPTLGTKYNAATCGVLATGGAEPHTSWSTASFASSGTATQFYVNSTPNPISGSAAVGLVTVYTASTNYGYFTTTAVASGVTKVLSSGSDLTRTIGGYIEKNVELTTGVTVPSRRAYFGVSTAGAPLLNATGTQWLDNAITWTAATAATTTTAGWTVGGIAF